MGKSREIIGKKSFKEKLRYGVGVFFGDAKQTWQRVISLSSALFWSWLELSFLIFFFSYGFGMGAYILGGDFSYSLEILRENRQLIKSLAIVFITLIFILRIRVHYGKEIKK